jgi:hypothetical protein
MLVGFLLGILFHPDDGCDTFVGSHQTAWNIAGAGTLHSQHCGNLKSNKEYKFQISTEQKSLSEEISEAQTVVCPGITHKTIP